MRELVVDDVRVQVAVAVRHTGLKNQRAAFFSRVHPGDVVTGARRLGIAVGVVGGGLVEHGWGLRWLRMTIR